MSGAGLSIDFGTSTTVAMLRTADGRVRPLIFDGSPLLPSAVYADPTAGLVVGADALHLGGQEPTRLEPHPKQRIDDGEVLLGDRAHPVGDLIAAVLRRVVVEAHRTLGTVPPAMLTHPVDWGTARRQILTSAAHAAGIPYVTLVSEPVAAAALFAARTGDRRPIGVFDLGAGTCDIAVLRHAPTGWQIAGHRGLNDLGGADIDAAVVDQLTRTTPHPEWPTLQQPRDAAQQRSRNHLWTAVRAAKENLSTLETTQLRLPGHAETVSLRRDELEVAARPLVERAAATAYDAIRDAGVDPGDLGGLYLVGGATRMPLISAVLTERLGIAPERLEQPELAVAEGALAFPSTPQHAGRTNLPDHDTPQVSPPAPDPSPTPPQASTAGPTATPTPPQAPPQPDPTRIAAGPALAPTPSPADPTATPPTHHPPSSGDPVVTASVPGSRPSWRRRWLLPVATALAVLAIATGAVAWWPDDGGGDRHKPATTRMDRSIRAFDFDNATWVSEGHSQGRTKITLNNGFYDAGDEGEYELTRGPVYADLDGDRDEDAAVELTWRSRGRVWAGLWYAWTWNGETAVQQEYFAGSGTLATVDSVAPTRNGLRVKERRKPDDVALGAEDMTPSEYTVAIRKGHLVRVEPRLAPLITCDPQGQEITPKGPVTVRAAPAHNGPVIAKDTTYQSARLTALRDPSAAPSGWVLAAFDDGKELTCGWVEKAALQ